MILDVHSHGVGLWAKHPPQSLNHPLLHRGGGSDGGGDGANAGNRDRDRPRRDKSHAHAHNLDSWSTYCLSANASRPHHNDCMPADSPKEDSEGSLSHRLLRRRDEIEWIALVEDECIVEDSKG